MCIISLSHSLPALDRRATAVCKREIQNYEGCKLRSESTSRTRHTTKRKKKGGGRTEQPKRTKYLKKTIASIDRRVNVVEIHKEARELFCLGLIFVPEFELVVTRLDPVRALRFVFVHLAQQIPRRFIRLVLLAIVVVDVAMIVVTVVPTPHQTHLQAVFKFSFLQSQLAPSFIFRIIELVS